MTRSLRSRARRGLVVGLAVAGLVGAAALGVPDAVCRRTGAARVPDPHAASASPGAVTGGALGRREKRAEALHGLEQLQHAGVRAARRTCWITADQLMAQSDAMHEKLQPYGYEYINIDAGWNGDVDEYGRPCRARRCTRTVCRP